MAEKVEAYRKAQLALILGRLNALAERTRQDAEELALLVNADALLRDPSLTDAHWNYVLAAIDKLKGYMPRFSEAAIHIAQANGVTIADPMATVN